MMTIQTEMNPKITPYSAIVEHIATTIIDEQLKGFQKRDGYYQPPGLMGGVFPSSPLTTLHRCVIILADAIVTSPTPDGQPGYFYGAKLLQTFALSKEGKNPGTLLYDNHATPAVKVAKVSEYLMQLLEITFTDKVEQALIENWPTMQFYISVEMNKVFNAKTDSTPVDVKLRNDFLVWVDEFIVCSIECGGEDWYQQFKERGMGLCPIDSEIVPSEHQYIHWLATLPEQLKKASKNPPHL